MSLRFPFPSTIFKYIPHLVDCLSLQCLHAIKDLSNEQKETQFKENTKRKKHNAISQSLRELCISRRSTKMFLCRKHKSLYITVVCGVSFRRETCSFLNRESNSNDIFTFVGLEKDAKQTYEFRKFNFIHCSGERHKKIVHCDFIGMHISIRYIENTCFFPRFDN